jgi:hypothetical protein
LPRGFCGPLVLGGVGGGILTVFEKQLEGEMKTSIEVAEGRVWIYGKREFENLPLSEGIQWILEQIHFGNREVKTDENGRAVSLIIGRDAAPSADSVSVDEAIEHDQNRQTALDLARLFATARESGIEPKLSEFADKVRNAATPEGAYRNTEFYYAFELVALLRRISEHTFLLDAPPILGRQKPLKPSDKQQDAFSLG